MAGADFCTIRHGEKFRLLFLPLRLCLRIDDSTSRHPGRRHCNDIFITLTAMSASRSVRVWNQEAEGRCHDMDIYSASER